MRKGIDCKGVEWEEIELPNVSVDLSQQTFKKLTPQFPVRLVALGLSSKKTNKHTYWDCVCDCGSVISVRSDRLRGEDAISCGCESSSKGECRIKNILNEYGVPYLNNKGYFRDLLGKNGSMLRYDFIIFSDDGEPIRLVEFDGPQHDEPVKWFGGEEHFQLMKEHDSLKNQYALSHNIPLVRIPYSKRDAVTYDDIFGDNYLIKGD